MLRREFVDKYNEDVTEAFRELFNTCHINMFHPGDLLLCQQNGFLLGKDTVIGFGEEGLNSIQHINSLCYAGIGAMTEDRDYFKKNGNGDLNGISELELTTNQEINNFQMIWENDFFLRVLAEVIRIARGEKYDWMLNMYNVKNKSNFIRDNIKKKLDVSPKFKSAVEIGYHRQIRNAKSHSQYHLIQEGIWFDKINQNNADEVVAIGFEEWEQIYCYSYFIFRGLFEHLKSIVQQLYMPMVRITSNGGIPVLCYYYDGTWRECYVFPDKTGHTWRFIKTN